jgi:hypothetical protein
MVLPTTPGEAALRLAAHNSQKCSLSSFRFAFNRIGGSTRPHKGVDVQGKASNCGACEMPEKGCRGPERTAGLLCQPSNPSPDHRRGETPILGKVRHRTSTALTKWLRAKGFKWRAGSLGRGRPLVVVDSGR